MDWEKILSIVTAVTAVIGIVLTWVQMELANKQALLDKRIDILSFVKSVLNIYQNDRETILKNEDYPNFAVDFDFLLLTNTPYLSDIYEIIKDPHNNELKTKFLSRLNDIDERSWKTKLIFTDECAEHVADFIIQYQLTLHELYRYQIVLKKMDQFNKSNQVLLIDLQKKFNEPTSKEKLRQQLNKLDLAYRKVKDHNCFAKLENETRLE